MHKSAFVKYNCKVCGDFVIIHGTSKPEEFCSFCRLPITYLVLSVFYLMEGIWIPKIGSPEELNLLWKDF